MLIKYYVIIQSKTSFYACGLFIGNVDLIEDRSLSDLPRYLWNKSVFGSLQRWINRSRHHPTTTIRSISDHGNNHADIYAYVYRNQ